MSIYLIADIEVHDPTQYAEYVKQARPLVEAAGGRYCVTGGSPQPLSGGWKPKRIVMIEFPSLEAMQTCFRSDAYRSIAPLRERSTTSRSIIVEGCDCPVKG